MLIRIISAVVAIPILLIFIILGGLPLRVASFVVSTIGMYELYKAVSGKIKPVHIVGFLLNTLYFCYPYISSYVHPFTDIKLLALSVIVIMFILVVFHSTNNIHDGAVTIFGFLYLGVIICLINDVRESSILYAWLPFIFAFASDTGAYFVGSKFGKHKLTPVLSPKKSVEGAVGGIVTTAVLSAVYALLCVKFFDMPKSAVSLLALMGAVGSVFGQLGDLAASSVKRYVGIKDYGNIMPGHGGVMDRFDSVLFTLPFVYVCILVIIP